jgi:hypothetical protein
MIKSHFDRKGEISISTARSYMEAKNIIDNEELDMLISNFHLNLSETGIDICRYMKKNNLNLCA